MGEATTLADFIRQRRAELGLSLSQMAFMTNITKGHIYKLEAGRVGNPSVSTIKALAAALRVSPILVFQCAAGLRDG